jgi:hypothetical protein
VVSLRQGPVVRRPPKPVRSATTAAEAIDVTRFIRGTTLVYPVLGSPTTQVKAPMLYNALFASTGVDAVVVPIEVAAADYPARRSLPRWPPAAPPASACTTRGPTMRAPSPRACSATSPALLSRQGKRASTASIWWSTPRRWAWSPPMRCRSTSARSRRTC